MKILLLNNFHYRRGGSEAVYFNTARLLKEHGQEVEFYSLRHEDNYPAAFDNSFAMGADAYGKLKGALKYIFNSEVSTGLERVISEFKPDVAHIHLIWGGLTPAALKTLSKHNIPVVHTAHDFRMVCPAYTFMNARGEMCEKCKGHAYYNCVASRCCKGSLAQSVLMAAESYSRNWRNVYKYIGNMHYVSRFSMEKHRQYNSLLRKVSSTVLYNFVPDPGESPTEGRECFTFCGRLSKEKGIETLVKAFAERPGLKLRIIGTGPMQDELQSQTRNLPNIEMLGYKTGDELRSLVAASRFVTIPSECFENNPMSALEAFSMGVPVIGANVGGVPEIVKPGVTGFMFESGNVSSLLEAIDKANAMANEEYQAMCASTRKDYLDNYTPDAYYPRLMQIYESAIEHCNR